MRVPALMDRLDVWGKRKVEQPLLSRTISSSTWSTLTTLSTLFATGAYADPPGRNHTLEQLG